VTDSGWFVRNVADADWYTHRGHFGSRCSFESPKAPFEHYGINLRVLEPDRPNCLYHREDQAQEDFLVLSGEATLLIDGEERPVKAWDFIHIPPGVEHVMVGGEGPCIVLMVGARLAGDDLFYPVSDLAAKYGASADEDTPDPNVAYARFGKHEPGRPPAWNRLPWASGGE
jgi:uncharacterized cupin superfamily protein